MKLLIVEGRPERRRALIRALRQEGHEVLQAGHCDGALRLYRQYTPDLVLMDVDSQGEDGYDCTRRLIGAAPQRFVPVILVAAPDTPVSLDRMLDSGAIDILDEPIQLPRLKAKLAGVAHMGSVYRQLEAMQSRTRQEVRMAQHMFDSMTNRVPDDVPALDHWTLAAGHFSGDLMLFERAPAGALHVFLGDFTGHGLSAAIGAIPTADIFFAMTRKGCGLGEIVLEINRKLHRLLPAGQFCAAIAVALHPARQAMEVWSGGTPPVLILDPLRHIVGQVEADNFPLGAVKEERFNAVPRHIDLQGAGHILLCSDGLTEARNAAGALFGDHDFGRLLRHPDHAEGSILDALRKGVIDFLSGMEPHDDISIMTLDLAAAS